MFIVKTIDETKQLIQNYCMNYPVSSTTLKVEDGLGYVTAECVMATIDLPHFNRSTVDGYAVMHSVVPQASAATPVVLKNMGSVEMGQVCKHTLDESSAVYVPTGGAIPNNATAVVMIENTDSIGDEVLINKRVSKWENVLMKGSDIETGNIVIEQHTRLTPTHIGSLKAVGISEIKVLKKLTALIISTGDEITDQFPPKVGEILDINTYTIKNYLVNYGVDVKETQVIKDDFDAYKEGIVRGMQQYDLVFSSGGSSVGDKDYTYKILETLDANVFVHGMNIKPGKPTILATLDNKLFVGLPGQPTSAYMVLNTLYPTIDKTIYQIKKPLYQPFLEGIITHNVIGAQGRRTYQLVTMSNVDPILITPLFSKSGMITSLSKADGYIIIDSEEEGVIKGDIVKVYRLGN